MTVAELVELLQQIPDQDGPAVIYSAGVEYRIVAATVSKMRANQLDANLEASNA